MKNCKICGNELTKPWQDTYCSNDCKYSDPELNAKRARKEKNDPTKRLKCNLCEYVTKDILNLGGHAVLHLQNMHGISDEEHLKYFTIVAAPAVEYWYCPKCDWKSKDLKNVSGWVTAHIVSHNISIEDFIAKYPEYAGMFKKQLGIIQKTNLLKDEDNSIECKVCKKKFYKLSNTHLTKHGLTPEQYKEKYGIVSTASNKTRRLQSDKSNDPTIKKKMVESLIKTNNERFGANSYTQTVEGKNTVRKRTLENTYNKYISSKLLNEHVQLLFSLDEYDGNVHKEYNFLCKKCNQIFTGKLENGRIPRCFACYPKINKGYSNSELEISDFIKNELHIETIQGYRVEKIEVDIYIPSKKIAIEYDGLYWHSELSGGKNYNYHISKTIICEKNGIFLIHIFEDEWMFKKDIVKGRLKSILGVQDKKLYARNCEMREIPLEEKDRFFNEYHLQGSDNSSVCSLGLFYQTQLVSAMTFAKYKYIAGLQNVYELSRFATKPNMSVAGAFSRLLMRFRKMHNPKSIITFADRRWSNKDNVYIKNGFEFTYATEPSYWYIDTSYNRHHRFQYRKSRLEEKLEVYDESLSEWENMQLAGYDRIWDCGNLKYEMILK